MSVAFIIMTASTGWNWNRVGGSFWTVPASDVYYFLARWKEADHLSVLDLGAGIGRHSLLFAKNGFRVTALDSAESGLRRIQDAARNEGLSIKTVLADAKELPFEDCAFDAVLAYHSIFHVDSDGMKSAIGEMERVLKPGGEVFLSLISKSACSYTDGASTVVDENVRLKKDEDGSVLPHYFCDVADVRKLLGSFEIISLRHAEDFWDDLEKSSWHYFVHARRRNDATRAI